MARALSHGLRRHFELHRRWVETNGNQGTQLTAENAGANFSDLHLDGVYFRKAKLVAAQFVNCSLVGADFTQADLSGTLFRDSNLTNVTFDEANLDFSAFGNNLEEAISFRGASMEMANIPSRRRRVTRADFGM
jgi:uncharacterized protein YjbI with pentapeptide repeats